MKLMVKSSDYLDSHTKEEIIHSIMFLKKAGLKNDDQIFDKISKDFKVSKVSVKEIADELKTNS